MQMRILKEVPSLLHEFNVLHEIVAYKKEEKEDVAALQVAADGRREVERQNRMQDAREKLAIREGRRRWNGNAQVPPAPLPQGPGPAPVQPSAPSKSCAMAPVYDFQQMLQQEMSKFMRQLPGQQPFAPIQPTAPVAAFAAPAAAFPAPVLSMPLAQKDRSPKRPIEESDDDMGDEGGEQDRRDQAIIEAGNRQDEKKTKKPRGNSYLLTKAGHPDMRSKPKIDVYDEPYWPCGCYDGRKPTCRF